MTRSTQDFDDTEDTVEAAWAAEIQQRVAAARAGELDSTDWRTVLNRVQKDVLGR